MWSKKVGKGQQRNVLLPLIFSGHIHCNSGFGKVSQVPALSWFRKEKKNFWYSGNFHRTGKQSFLLSLLIIHQASRLFALLLCFVAVHAHAGSELQLFSS